MAAVAGQEAIAVDAGHLSLWRLRPWLTLYIGFVDLVVGGNELGALMQGFIKGDWLALLLHKVAPRLIVEIIEARAVVARILIQSFQELLVDREKLS
jgi:hypothetical protein